VRRAAACGCARSLEHLDLVTGQTGQVRRDALGQVHAETLGGDRVAIFMPA
jgi:hypothetical protein